MKDLVLKLVEYIDWILIIMISFGLWQLNCLLLTLFHNGLNLNYVFLYLIFNFWHVHLLKHYLNMWLVFEKKTPKIESHSKLCSTIIIFLDIFYDHLLTPTLPLLMQKTFLCSKHFGVLQKHFMFLDTELNFNSIATKLLT